MNVKVNKYIYIFFISFFFIFTLYHLTKQASIIFSDLVVPTGDPFSYELNLIHLNNESSLSIRHYLVKLITTFVSSQWYYAYKLPIALFAPLISNDHSTLIIVNYFYLLLAFICVQTSLRIVSNNYIINFFSTVTICFLPWLWGYKSPISLQTLALDTQVYLVGVAYFALLLKSFFNLRNNRDLTITAIIGGLFIWTRGNSFSYFVFLTLPILSIFCLRFYYFSKKKRGIIIKKIYKPILIFLFIFFWYAFFTYDGIINYYSTQSSVIEYKSLNFQQVLYSLKIIFFNFPGCFFSSEYFLKITFKNIFFSVLFYLTLFLSFFYFYKKKRLNIKNLKLFYILLISIVTTLFLKLLELYNIPFVANGISTAHAQITPLIPFTLVYIFLINYMFNIYENKFNKINLITLLLLISTLIFSTLHSFINTKIKNGKKIYITKKYPVPKKNYYKRMVNANELKTFSLNLDKNKDNPRVYTLIYNFYNPVILNYYREKNNLKKIERNSELESDIIAPYISNPNFRGGKEKFKSSFVKILNDADYIIIPKLIDDYKYIPYILTHKFYDQMYSIINNKENPKFQVVMELNDWIDLVLIKKVDQNENFNIYDGIRKNYENVSSDINIMKNETSSLWNNLIKINSYRELIQYKNMKLFYFGYKRFPLSNLFDKNFDTFWQTENNNGEIILKFNEKIKLNEIILFTKDRSNKKNENFHEGSFRGFPIELKIYGSENLEDWNKLAEIKNMSLKKNKYSINFKNNEEYYYYLIKLKNNDKFLRIYEIKFNNEIRPKSFISIKHEEK